MPIKKSGIIEPIQEAKKEAREYIAKIEKAITDLLIKSDYAFTCSEIVDELLADIPLATMDAIKGHLCLIRGRKNVFVDEIDGKTYYCMESPSTLLVDK
ncbi:hypothetical protein GQ568_00215 [Patescibacteria group bacterium]|nr:hypothetical protein [Patescibacteria group bacterium]